MCSRVFKKNNTGAVLFMVILFSLIMMLVGYALISLSQRERILSIREFRIDSAHYMAEVGIDRAKYWLEHIRPTPEDFALANFGSQVNPFDPFGGDQHVPVAGPGSIGTYRVTIDPDDGNPASQMRRYVMHSTGTYVNIEKSMTSSFEMSLVAYPDTGQDGRWDASGRDPANPLYNGPFGQDADYRFNSCQVTFTDNGDGTITDDVTGLMWIADTTSAECFNGNELPWYDDGGGPDIFSQCAAVNAASFAGHNDWRIPNVRELMSIVNYDEWPAVFDSFIVTGSGSGWSLEYWTATTNANNTGQAWRVGLHNGEVIRTSNKKNSSRQMILVRGTGILPDTFDIGDSNVTGEDSEIVTVVPSYTNNGDGTISDNVTGLMWMGDDTPTWINNAPGSSWVAAINFCETLLLCNDNVWTNEAGTWASAGAPGATNHDGIKYDDWRLPNIKELQSIVDYGTNQPAMSAPFVTVNNWHWSSTTCGADLGGTAVGAPSPDDASLAMAVQITSGRVGSQPKGGDCYIRPVRGPGSRKTGFQEERPFTIAP